MNKGRMEGDFGDKRSDLVRKVIKYFLKGKSMHFFR